MDFGHPSYWRNLWTISVIMKLGHLVWWLNYGMTKALKPLPGPCTVKNSAARPTSGSSDGHDVWRILITYPLDWQFFHLKWRLIGRSFLLVAYGYFVWTLQYSQSHKQKSVFSSKSSAPTRYISQLLCNALFQAGIESLPPEKRYQ